MPNSLVDRPASGYEAGWSLNVDATVNSQPLSPTQAQPVSPFSAPTILAPGQHPAQPTQIQPLTTSPAQQPGAWKRPVLFLAGAGAILGLLILVLILLGSKGSDKGKNEKRDNPVAEVPKPPELPQPDAPRVLIDEDFHTAYEKKLAIPEGWVGDAFRVIETGDEHCLEVIKTVKVERSLSQEPSFVKLPLKSRLPGNFSIEGEFHMKFGNRFLVSDRRGVQHLTIRLINRKNEILDVAIDQTGAVLIGDGSQSASPNYTPGTTTKFLLTRKGDHLNLWLNDELVASKDLGEVTEYETLMLGLTEGGSQGRDVGECRLYQLKVATLSADGSVPTSNTPLPKGSAGDPNKKGKK
jgi:hypothetical protein